MCNKDTIVESLLAGPRGRNRAFRVNLYDSEIPICWDKQNGLYLLTETMSGDITHDMMVEILSVMDIIRDNLNWFTEILGLRGEQL